MDDIKKQYIDYVLRQHKRPSSIYLFMKELGKEEREFYADYASFQQLESAIWADALKDTVNRVRSDSTFAEYSARERMLALYYAFIESLKNIRSFAIFSLKGDNCSGAAVWKALEAPFSEFAKQVVNDGVYNGEIADRPFLTDRYSGFLWYQMMFVVRYWLDDSSTAFEKTDIAIEKAVNLAFDLLGKNIVDSAFDFGRFVFTR